MKRGIITCDVCGDTGAKTCSFYVDRHLDAAGSTDDFHEYMDLCPAHQFAAYQIAEKKHGFELANHVYEQLRARAVSMTKARNERLASLTVLHPTG